MADLSSASDNSSTSAETAPSPLRSVHTTNFSAILDQLNSSLLVTTYQAGKLVVLRSDGAEQHLERRHPERQTQGSIAIVRVEPVVPGLEVHAGRHEHGFVPGAADLEEDQALVLELNLFVVEPPGHDHRPVRTEQIFTGEAVEVVAP